MSCCTQQTEEFEVNNLSANSHASARGYNSSGVSPNEKSGANSIVARPTSSVANKDMNNTTMEFGGA